MTALPTAPHWSDLVRTRLMYGRDRARTLSALAEQMRVSRRVIEAAVEAARREGAPICSDGSGLWLAQTAEEVRECADRLNRRLVTQYRTVRAMRQTAQRMRAPTLVQQDLGW
jgi:thiamine pyrophosphate-dependent acetolactate synthase large subunit-like protein